MMPGRAKVTGMPLRDRFLGLQCRFRQEDMRKRGGKPAALARPLVVAGDSGRELGPVVTVLCRKPEFSVTDELAHIARRTHDPSQRREDAIRYFSESYFAKPSRFSETLTASFPPGSRGAGLMEAAGDCLLKIDSGAEEFRLSCRARALGRRHPLRMATWWHNFLFSPSLHPDATVIGFDPDWDRSEVAPAA